jgi:hypothetical protein
MANTITEGRRTGEYLVSEAAGHRSREQGTALSGQTFKAGHVLGKVAHGAATPAADAGNTSGSGTIGSVTVGAGAKAGVYVATCIEPGSNAGKFMVQDPDGVEVGVATVGTPFTGGGLTFTISDATDFVSGDRFTITVALGSNKFKEWNPDNTDGSEVACAISYSNVDASTADKRFVYTARDAEVNGLVLEYFDEADDNDKALAKSQLAAAGIIVR